MGKKVMIVEDDVELLGLLEKRLKTEGYDVAAVSQGHQVIARALSFVPELILMDIMLPDMDGAEAVKMLQDNDQTKHIRVLFLSGIVTPEEGQEEASLRVGGKSYPAISKPFTADELLKKISQILG